MFEIVYKAEIAKDIYKMNVKAPRVAKKAKPGHFVIIRVHEDGERMPLSISGFDADEGTVTIIFHAIGPSTIRLSKLEVGDCLASLTGPLGKATDITGMERVLVVGGGMGSTICYPVARKLFERDRHVETILGFKNADLVTLHEEFKAVSHICSVVTDDGSYADGGAGFVTEAVRKRLEENNDIDHVIAIGPTLMLKALSEITREYGIKTIVSLSPIMMDGTGMCGGCRVTIGGERKFVCVDGPEFDGHLVDYDEIVMRHGICNDLGRHEREDDCNIFSLEVAE